MLTGLSCKRVNRAPLSLKLKKKGKKSKEGRKIIPFKTSINDN